MSEKSPEPEPITSYHCPYCDASFEYGTDRDKHMRECPGHPAAIRERQRIIELLNERIRELGLKGSSPTNKVAIASRRGEMKRLRDQLQEFTQHSEGGSGE